MEASYHRHDISDEVWALLEPHLPGQRGQWGGIAQDNRRFINAVFWVLRNGRAVSSFSVCCHPTSFPVYPSPSHRLISGSISHAMVIRSR